MIPEVYNRGMPHSTKPTLQPEQTKPTTHTAQARDEAVLCERCGAEMFRMHAVWRCPACRYKTDCCGW